MGRKKLRMKRCKYCKERFEEYKRGRRVYKKTCPTCLHNNAVLKGLEIKKKWARGEITRKKPWNSSTNTAWVGHLAPSFTSETMATIRFTQVSIYLSEPNITQHAAHMMFGISKRAIRNWLNKYYPKRENRKNTRIHNGLRNNTIELNKINDKDMREFVTDYNNNKFNPYNPVMKAIHLWNKKVEIITGIKEEDEKNGMVKISET